MYVCVCNAVTERDIHDAVENGVQNMNQLTRTTGCSSTCGSCQDMAAEILADAMAEKRVFQGFLPVMQMA
jgi:bacterioferritin-associated ferredoxin